MANEDEPKGLSRRRFLKAAGTGAAVVATGGVKAPVQIAAAAAPVIKEVVQKAVGETVKRMIPKGLFKILKQIEGFQSFRIMRTFSKGEYDLSYLERVIKTGEMEKTGVGLPDLGYLNLIDSTYYFTFGEYDRKRGAIDDLKIKDFFGRHFYDYAEGDYEYEEDDDNYDYNTEDGEPILIPKRDQKDIDEDLQKYLKQFLEITGAGEDDTIKSITDKLRQKELDFYREYIKTAENIAIDTLFDKEEIIYLIDDLISAGNNKYRHIPYLYERRKGRSNPYLYLRDLENYGGGYVKSLMDNEFKYLPHNESREIQKKLYDIVRDLDKRLYEIETSEREELKRKQKDEEEKRKKNEEEEEKKKEEQRKIEAKEKRKAENEKTEGREGFECDVEEIREDGWFPGLDTTFTITKQFEWKQSQQLKIVDVRKYFEMILSEIYNKKVEEGYDASLETFKKGFNLKYLVNRNRDSIKVVTSNLDIIYHLREAAEKGVYIKIPNKSYEDPNKFDTDQELEEILSEKE